LSHYAYNVTTDNPHLNKIKRQLYNDTMQSCHDNLNKIQQQLNPLTQKLRAEWIGRLKYGQTDSNISRPMVVAHAGYGKTRLRESSLTLDVDDYVPKAYHDGANEMAIKGINPYKFIAMASGTGKSHIIKFHNPGNKFVELDDLLAKLPDVPTDIKNKFESNVVDAQTVEYVRLNLFKVLRAGQVVLVHMPQEIPEGGELLNVFSYPLYEERVVSKLSPRQAELSPVAIPQDSWHNWKTISFTRAGCLQYHTAITSKKPIEEWFLSYFGIRVKFSLDTPYFGPPPKTMPVKLTKGNAWPKAVHNWQIINERKWWMVGGVLDETFPEGWANRSAGKLMLVHTKHDVKNLNGLLVGSRIFRFRHW